jgi:hypothetical protein
VTLGDVFRELNALQKDGVVQRYALGGATAVLFYAEPTRTYDLDVFVVLPSDASASLTPLHRIYAWARARGFTSDAEHVLIHGVPVQFLPAYNLLVGEAVAEARTYDYGGGPVQVVGPEHLVALALQAGGARRRERAWQLLEAGAVDRQGLAKILARHAIAAEIPDDV